MSADTTRLRFADHTQPRVSIGMAPLVPANMRRANDRLRYLRGLVQYLDALLADTRRSAPDALPLAKVFEVLDRIPFARDLVAIVSTDHGLVARAREGAKDLVSFDAKRLTLAFPDGRVRTSASSLWVRTGEATADVVPVVAALARGARRRELAALGQALPELGELLDALLAKGLVEAAHGPRVVDARFSADAEGDRVTWLGHAAVAFASGRTHVWIDPLLYPRLTYRPDEAERLASRTHAERRLFQPNDARALTLYDLPTPDAICITHQDADHLDLGVLMCVPEHVPVIVPRSTGSPWDIDLAALLHDILGSKRNVVVLGHGEHHRVGDVRITAFPFRGEMPESLEHGWNGYLLETARSRLACAADARLSDDEIAILAGARTDRRPLTLFAGPPRVAETIPGWREGKSSPVLYNSSRLYSWYQPPVGMFDPAPYTNVTFEQLGALARKTRLSAFFPYAMGSAPWFRIEDRRDPFHLGIGSLGMDDVAWIERSLAKAAPGVAFFPGTYGRPTRIDDGGGRKRKAA